MEYSSRYALRLNQFIMPPSVYQLRMEWLDQHCSHPSLSPLWSLPRPYEPSWRQTLTSRSGKPSGKRLGISMPCKRSLIALKRISRFSLSASIAAPSMLSCEPGHDGEETSNERHGTGRDKD